jgi:hypothetical protein
VLDVPDPILSLVLVLVTGGMGGVWFLRGWRTGKAMILPTLSFDRYEETGTYWAAMAFIAVIPLIALASAFLAWERLSLGGL